MVCSLYEKCLSARRRNEDKCWQDVCVCVCAMIPYVFKQTGLIFRCSGVHEHGKKRAATFFPWMREDSFCPYLSCFTWSALGLASPVP